MRTRYIRTTEHLEAFFKDARAGKLKPTDRVRAYKFVTASLLSPYRSWSGPIRYKVGKTFVVPGANTDRNLPCGAGLHVATENWCRSAKRSHSRLLLVEFTVADIACIPYYYRKRRRWFAGKFRVRKLTVVRELVA